MRWALLGLTLLVAAFGLLYRGGVAFVSSLSGATASLRVDAPDTAVATPGQMEGAMRPDRRSPAKQTAASEMPRPDTLPAGQPPAPSDPVDLSPSATEQRLYRSRGALETMDPREFVRQRGMTK